MAVRPIDGDALRKELTCDFTGTPFHGNKKVTIGEVRRIIESMPTLTPPNEWISVEERLPESIVNKVLVYCENGYIGYGHYEKYQGEETWYNLESGEPFSSWSLQNCLPYKVTHWMPLPKPPETMTKRMEAVDDA